jgi:transposase
VINQLRAFLLDRGLTFHPGRAHLLNQMPTLLADLDATLSPRMAHLIRFLWEEWKSLECQFKEMRNETDNLAKQDLSCRRLLDVPGVGTLVATALVASVGNGSAFLKGREFAAWLGLVPKQYSTGGKQ